MHRWLYEWKGDFTRARESRIRLAMAFYEKHQCREREELMRRNGERICMAFLGMCCLAPIFLCFGGEFSAGMAFFITGLLGFFAGMFVIATAGHSAEKTLAECFALADQEQSRLAEMVRENKDEKIREIWSNETI